MWVVEPSLPRPPLQPPFPPPHMNRSMDNMNPPEHEKTPSKSKESKPKKPNRGGLCCGSRQTPANAEEDAGSISGTPRRSSSNGSSSADGAKRQSGTKQKRAADTKPSSRGPLTERQPAERRAVAVKSFEDSKATHSRDLPFRAGQVSYSHTQTHPHPASCRSSANQFSEMQTR